MEQFYNFNLNLNNINNGCKNSVSTIDTKNGTNSTKANPQNDFDTFENQNRNKKKAVIFSYIAGGILLLGILAKTGKLIK